MEQGYLEDILPLYEMMYGILTSLLILGALYLLMSRRNIRGQMTGIIRNLRVKAGLGVLVWGLSYIVHYYVILKAIKNGTGINDRTAVIMFIAESCVIMGTITVFIFTLVQNRTVQICMVTVLAVIMGSFSVWYGVTGKRIITLYYIGIICMYAIAVLVMFSILYRKYDRWLADNYSDTGNNDIRWTQGLPVFMIVQICVFTVRILRPHIMAEITGDVANLAFEIFIIINMDRMESRPGQEYTPVTDTAVNDITIYNDNDYMTEPDPVLDIMEDNRTQIGRRLMQYCSDNRLYLKSGLTSSELSLAIGVNRSYLSRYFSEHGTNFYGYINRLRVHHAIEIMENSNGEQTLLSIASQSGFNSLNTFNRAFREYMSTTPGEYYEHVLEGNITN